jgi:hypothetical protein
MLGAGVAGANIVGNLALDAYDYYRAADRHAFAESWQTKVQSIGRSALVYPSLGLSKLGERFGDRIGVPGLLGKQSAEEQRRSEEEERYRDQHLRAAADRARAIDAEKRRAAQIQAELAAARGDDVRAAEIQASEFLRTASIDWMAQAKGEKDPAAALAEERVAQAKEIDAAQSAIRRARRQAADLRGRNLEAAASVTELIAQQQAERATLRGTNLSETVAAQLSELRAMREQALRPRGYLQAGDPLSELPGGPGGEEGNQMVEFLRSIDAGIQKLIGLPGGNAPAAPVLGP